MNTLQEPLQWLGLIIFVTTFFSSAPRFSEALILSTNYLVMDLGSLLSETLK